MSRDILVQDIPADITSVEQIPDGWMPLPLSVTAEAIRAATTQHASHADFADPHLRAFDPESETGLFEPE